MQATNSTFEERSESDLVQVGGGSGIPFNGNQVKRAVALLPREQAAALVWLFEHGRDNQFDLDGLASFLRRARPDGSFTGHLLYSIYRGRYCGNLVDVVAAILAYRSLVLARESIGRPGFIVTKLTKRIRQVCEHARTYQRVAMVFGDGQIGKSKNLEEHARTTENTRYLRLPSEAPARLVVELLGRACYLNTHRPSTTGLRAEIVAHFEAGMLLIVDELQQITLARTARDRLATVEFLREIFDTSGCGLVLCGTNEAMREVESGPNALWLRQLRRRSLPKIMLPSKAEDGDILAFAEHYGLGSADMPAEAISKARQVAAEDGVGLLITYLQGAARMAAAERQIVTWAHFLRTIKALNGEAGCAK